jgi:hypothetical protein
MGHMGNSGRIAIAAAIAAGGLLVLTAITLEESVLFAFLGTVAAGYLACVFQVAARGRNLILLVGGVGTSLFIGFAIAFLRMWGLAFTAEPDALGAAVTSQDSDIYFYLAAVAGVGTLLIMFGGAVWPAGKRLRPERSQGRRSPTTRTQSGRTQSGRTQGRVPASRSGAVRAPAKRPSSPSPKAKVPVPAARVAARPSAKSPAKATSRR